MKRRNIVFLCLTVAVAVWANAQNRNWQKGTLLETEQTKVRDGSTRHTTSNGDNSSQTSTTTTTENYDTYQVFTIDAGQKIYVSRERLLFPWSKPALATVGEEVKFAVEKNNIYIMGEDGKQHKSGIVKVSMKPSPAQ
jgi:hypothetical protein